MKRYKQHGCVSTFEHCENVARLCYRLNRALFLRANLRTLLIGAMLHDFFLYDWHEEGDGSHRLHGFSHAGRACRNAEKYFEIDKEIRHVIYCHMWPLNLQRVPMSREAWLVCLADKYVSLQETLFRR
ncbi:MAG: HD domain-containing protein [Lachnospiraceae bacterium]|nr:HD domain-containing protein [Lachnospiraceae bacterium]